MAQSKSADIKQHLEAGKLSPKEIADKTGASVNLVYNVKRKLNGKPSNTSQRIVGKEKPTRKISASSKSVAKRVTAQTKKSLPTTKQIGGDHYKKLRIQPWDAMEEWLSPEEFKGYLKGNIIKYMARKKSPDDALKAEHYLQKLASLS